MDEALTALLLGDAGLSALVGGRVHWGLLPGEVTALPYVRVQVISSPEAYTYEAPSALRQWAVQLDLWAETAGAALAAERAARALLSGYRGEVAGVQFRGIFIDRAEGSVEDVAGFAGQLHRRRLDLSVNWRA